MPYRAAVAARWSRVPSMAGAAPGRKSATGWGAKVTMTAGTPCSRALRTVVAMSCWWPRWTPSKTPTVTEAPVRFPGTLSVPFQISMTADITMPAHSCLLRREMAAEFQAVSAPGVPTYPGVGKRLFRRSSDTVPGIGTGGGGTVPGRASYPLGDT